MKPNEGSLSVVHIVISVRQGDGTFAHPMYRPMQIMDDQINQSSLAQDTIVKVKELTSLVYKYRQYQKSDPNEIAKWAVHGLTGADVQLNVHRICVSLSNK